PAWSAPRRRRSCSRAPARGAGPRCLGGDAATAPADRRASHAWREVPRACLNRGVARIAPAVIRREIRPGPARGDHSAAYIECSMQTASQRRRDDESEILCVAARLRRRLEEEKIENRQVALGRSPSATDRCLRPANQAADWSRSYSECRVRTASSVNAASINSENLISDVVMARILTARSASARKAC